MFLVVKKDGKMLIQPKVSFTHFSLSILKNSQQLPNLNYFFLLIVTCPKCEHPRAYFMQIQTRSADEPMSIFYKCCNHECQHQWNEK